MTIIRCLRKVLFEQAVRLKKETGAHIKFINLSGGIGIPYRPDQEPNDIYAIGEGVRKVYEEVSSSGRNGGCSDLYRTGTLHDGTLRLSGNKSNPRENILIKIISV